MSRADEMMIDSGYKKVDLGFLFSRFWEQWEKWENVDLEKTISFNIEHKYFKVEDENEYGITIQELQAINEKVKELRLDMKEIIDVTSKYEDLYNTALEDVVRLSKENIKLKSENIRLKDVNANLKNVNANLNLEKGRLQGNLDYKNQRLKEYEKQLDLDYVDNNYISKSKLETEIKACEEVLKHCNKKADTDRIKTLNERIMLCKELLRG